MAIEKVKEYFNQFGLTNRIKEFSVSSATVDLAAAALNCDQARIAKSLSFWINNKPIIIVMAGDVKVDNHKFKNAFQVKAKMLSFEETADKIGHAVGGVCPFAVNPNIDVYLDDSLKRFESVFPACGSSNSAIELTIEELEKYSNYISWVDVCKPKEVNL